MLRAGRRVATPVLLIGVLAISSAAIFIRLSAATASVTALYRLLLSSALMWCALALRPGVRARAGVPWRYAVPAGAALAAHFWLWMRSLEMTSVLVSTLFVTTTPLWLGLVAPLIPREPRLTRVGWMGLTTALAGACLLALADNDLTHAGTRPLLGALFATAGAWAMATYLALSRFARRTIDFLRYGAVTTAIAAATLILPVVISGSELLHFPATTWAAIAAMAILPQLIGHNSLVWAVRFVGATSVALVLLLEPVTAGALALLIFDERPTLLHGAAALVLLFGLTVVLRSRTEPDERPHRA